MREQTGARRECHTRCHGLIRWLTLGSAVTAVYKGTQKGGDPALLRSYDSRKEPAPEFDCKIWEAGRATCAIGLAFKPIQIGQSVFHDDGAGHYNPSPTALDEAVVNEWPGRDVGVFVSVGTGKRPRGSDAASAAWYDGFLGEFADARRKLIAKIEGCERIHELMRTEHLARRGVNVEAYYRLNVEVGVGEFGMNEWHRLADISTNTRRYMARSDEQKLVQGASAKLAKIHLAKLRWHRTSSAAPAFQDTLKPAPAISSALAVELPGDIPVIRTPNSASDDRRSYDSGVDDMAGPPDANVSPETSSIHVVETPSKSTTKQRLSPGPAASGPVPAAAIAEAAVDPDRLIVIAPTPAQYQDASEAGRSDDARARAASFAGYHAHAQPPPRIEPPPLPPKTPLSGWDAAPGQRMPTAAPYPTDDEPPPVVNVAGKPRYTVR